MSTSNDNPDSYEDLILALAVVPGRDAPISAKEFLQRIHVETGVGLAGKFLRRSIMDRNGDGVELSLIVGHVFGFLSRDLPLLHELACVEWHCRHEEVVTVLGRMGNASSVGPLLCNINRDVDQVGAGEGGVRSLTDKTIRSLGQIGGSEAEEALRSLASSGDEFVQKAALRQLQRRPPG